MLKFYIFCVRFLMRVGTDFLKCQLIKPGAKNLRRGIGNVWS